MITIANFFKMAYIFIYKEPMARQFLQKLEIAYICSIFFFSKSGSNRKKMANSKNYEENVYRAMGKVEMELSYKTKHALPTQHNCTLRHFFQRNKELWLHRNLYMNVHRHSIPWGQNKAEERLKIDLKSREQGEKETPENLYYMQILSSSISQSKICLLKVVFIYLF